MRRKIAASVGRVRGNAASVSRERGFPFEPYFFIFCLHFFLKIERDSQPTHCCVRICCRVFQDARALRKDVWDGHLNHGDGKTWCKLVS